MTVTIRPAASEDFSALVAILRGTFESTWRPQLTEAAAQAYNASDPATTYIDERGLEFRVAERDGEVVGLVHWRDDFVHALHVRSHAARAGVGTRLMDRAEAEVAGAGFAKVRLETDTFNTRARAFYAARGYQEVGRYPDEEWNSGITTLLLEKRLDV